MDQPSEPPDEFNPKIVIEPEQMAGVWANFARVSHSPYEFTLDFVRLDFTSNPPNGIVVARVSLSPLLISQLISALDDNWNRYAEKAFPPEVQGYGREEGGSARDPKDSAP
jgi:hypothetical protein